MDLDIINMRAQLNAIQQQLNRPRPQYHQSYNNNNDNRNNKNIVCFYCNKPGHVKRHCKKRMAAIKELDNKQRDFQNV